MRIATVRAEGAEQLAVADGDGYRRLNSHGDLTALLRAGVDPRQLPLGELVDGDLATPLRPGKVVAIGLNYLDHIRESNLERPERTVILMIERADILPTGD